MSLLQHQSQYWPLALSIAHGEPTLEQHFASLAAWDQWFAQGTPFHIIRVYLDAASLRHATGAAQATQAWMSAGAAEQMREWVQSMLIVVPADQYQSMKKMSVRKAFGIPGALFPSLNDAYSWMANPPEAVKGLPLDKKLLEDVRHTIADIALLSVLAIRSEEISSSLHASLEKSQKTNEAVKVSDIGGVGYLEKM